MRPCRPRPLLAALPLGSCPSPQLASLASLATPAFMAALMVWQAECMRDDGSFGAWLRPWRIVPQCVFTFTFTVCIVYCVLCFLSIQSAGILLNGSYGAGAVHIVYFVVEHLLVAHSLGRARDR